MVREEGGIEGERVRRDDRGEPLMTFLYSISLFFSFNSKPLVSVSNFFSATETKIIMFGLDGSGKTSVSLVMRRKKKKETIDEGGSVFSLRFFVFVFLVFFDVN